MEGLWLVTCWWEKNKDRKKEGKEGRKKARGRMPLSVVLDSSTMSKMSEDSACSDLRPDIAKGGRRPPFRVFSP